MNRSGLAFGLVVAASTAFAFQAAAVTAGQSVDPSAAPPAAAGTCFEGQPVIPADAVPPGFSVLDCDAVGRNVAAGGITLAIPPEGHLVGAAGQGAETVSGSEDDAMLALSVSEGGELTITTGVDVTSGESIAESEDDTTHENDGAHQESTSGEGVSAGTTTVGTAHNECNHDAYNLHGEKHGGTFEWYLGDGVRPAGRTTTQTADILKSATHAWD
jgi:hypothetical protein